MRAADISYPNPFTGTGTGGIVALLEVGYHLPLAVFHQLGDVSWDIIARYFPSVFFVMTALSVYIMAQRKGFGWEAAFFTCLIPTTIGIMGPALLVPVAMGLMFVPLALFVAFNYRTFWSYVVLLIFICFMIIMHAPSGICLIIILVPFIMLSLARDSKHGLGMMLVVAIPFLVTLPWTSDLILSTAKTLLSTTPLPAYHDFPLVIQKYGYLPILASLVGTFVLGIRGGRINYSLLLSLLALTAMSAIFYTLHYGVPILYLRGLLYMMLIMSMVAGAGLMELRRLEIPGIARLKSNAPLIVGTAGMILLLIFISITLSIAIPNRQGTLYYRMIEREDYEAFVWIRDNVDESYQTAILDPWKATAFTAITERYVYARTHTAPTDRDRGATEFLEGGCKNTGFLTENGISIVYSQVPSSNPDLMEVRTHVYLLKK